MKKNSSRILIQSVLPLAIFFAAQVRAEECTEIKVFIKSSYGNAGCDGKGKGHSGISVLKEYYDYGPYSWTMGKRLLSVPFLVGISGDSWYDSDETITSDKNANEKEIIKYYQNADCPSVYFVAKVTMSQAQTIKKYWDDLYSDKGFYTFWGKQCTTTVFSSLKEAGVLPEKEKRVLLPIKFYKTLRYSLKNTCGAQSGKHAKLAILSGETFWENFEAEWMKELQKK